MVESSRFPLLEQELLLIGWNKSYNQSERVREHKRSRPRAILVGKRARAEHEPALPRLT